MRRVVLLLPLCGALLLVACSGGDGDRPDGEAASPSDDAQAAGGRPPTRADVLGPTEWDPAVRDLVAFVEQERGLSFDHPVSIDFLEGAAFDESYAAAGPAASNAVRRPAQLPAAVARALGLRNPDADPTIVQELLVAATRGFYSYDTRRIVIRGDGDLDVSERVTLVGELTLALQDQHFDLTALAAPENSPRIARGLAAVTDGDANLIVDAYRKSLGEADRAAYDTRPPVVPREVSAGVIDAPDIEAVGRAEAHAWRFVADIAALGGRALLDEAFADPPLSEEQILHPLRWLASEPIVEVPPPAPGDGGMEQERGELGQSQLLWLLAERIDFDAAWRAADQWAGGAYLVYRTRAGRSCIRFHVAAGSAGGLRELDDALAAWAPTLAAAEAERVDDYVRATACDEPGAVHAPAALGQHRPEDFIVSRALLIRAYRDYFGYLASVCLIDDASEQLGFARLFEDDEARRAAVAEATGRCAVSRARPGPPLIGPEGWDVSVVDLAGFVERARGLPFLRPVPVDFLDAEAFAVAVRDAFAGAAPISPPIEVARALGLASGELDVTGLEELSGVVLDGFYDPRDGRIRVRGTDLAEPLVQFALAHELTHAVQDQHTGLARPEAAGYFGSFSPFRTLVEGDATRIAAQYLLTSGSAQEDLIESLRRRLGDFAGRISPEDLATPGARTLEYYANLVLLPYAIGTTTSAVIADVGGVGGLNDAFATPPTSEEHLLHPDRWLAGERIVEVPPPDLPPGAEELHRGPFGMVHLLLMLSARLGFDAAWEAVDGWGGDALLVYRDNGRTCVRLAIAADSIPGQRALVAGVAAWAEAFPPATWEEAGIVTVSSCDPGRDFRPAPPPSALPLAAVLNQRAGLIAGFRAGATVGEEQGLCVADALLERVGAEAFVRLRAGRDSRDLMQALETCDVEL